MEEKEINPFLHGEFSSRHVKQGIIVRKATTSEFIGIIVESFGGYSIRTPSDQLFGKELTVNGLMTRLSNVYKFYLV